MGEEERTKARAELGERYGVVWHEELIPEVRARFGLQRFSMWLTHAASCVHNPRRMVCSTAGTCVACKGQCHRNPL
jgi:hypothetical protein